MGRGSVLAQLRRQVPGPCLCEGRRDCPSGHRQLQHRRRREPPAESLPQRLFPAVSGERPGPPEVSHEAQELDPRERISWDEAATYIHDEVERINGTYGDNSILTLGGEANSLLNKLNINYLNSWTTSSWGTWYAPGPLGWGDGCNYYDCNNDRLDFLNCDYVVAFGYNPAWAALGNATNYAVEWKKAGVKFIIFDPIYTDSAAILDAKWIPIHPGTDMAAMMAMSYVLLEEDDNGSLIDWDFLDRCCVGQDKDHMPADVKSDENYFDYLRGEYDGVPKTPEWAEKITGIPADTLREVARILGKDNNVAVLSSWASARTYDTEQLPQTAICMAAMGGHIGKSGNCVGPTAWNHTNNFGPRLVKVGSSGPNGATGGTGKATMVCDTQVWNAVFGEPFNPTNIFNAINGAGPKGWKDAIAGYDLTKRVDYITAPVKMIWEGRRGLPLRRVCRGPGPLPHRLQQVRRHRPAHHDQLGARGRVCLGRLYEPRHPADQPQDRRALL